MKRLLTAAVFVLLLGAALTGALARAQEDTPTPEVEPTAETGPVQAVLPESIPCTKDGSRCRYDIVIEFWDLSGVGAQVEDLRLRYIDRDGGVWVGGAGISARYDDPLEIPASGSAVFDTWVRTEDKLMGGSIRVLYEGHDANGNPFSGELTAALAWPDWIPPSPTPTLTFTPSADQAEVVASLPESIPCTKDGDECRYDIVVTFTEQAGLGAQVEDLRLRYIDRDGGVWVGGAGISARYDDPLEIPVLGRAVYDTWVRTEDKLMGGSIRVLYEGHDANGTPFSGELTAALEWPDWRDAPTPTATQTPAPDMPWHGVQVALPESIPCQRVGDECRYQMVIEFTELAGRDVSITTINLCYSMADGSGTVCEKKLWGSDPLEIPALGSATYEIGKRTGGNLMGQWVQVTYAGDDADGSHFSGSVRTQLEWPDWRPTPTPAP
ncbi:MAG: hypothetical protein JXJ20_13525 [Anaerolineae bacterium]|nr:hypothetical protein [Anaerolineae bacterium]